MRRSDHFAVCDVCRAEEGVEEAGAIPGDWFTIAKLPGWTRHHPASIDACSAECLDTFALRLRDDYRRRFGPVLGTDRLRSAS